MIYLRVYIIIILMLCSLLNADRGVQYNNNDIDDLSEEIRLILMPRRRRRRDGCYIRHMKILKL